MKNRVAALVGIVSILLAIAIIVLAYLMLHHPRKMAALNDLTVSKPVMHPVVVLDFDDNGLLDDAELKQGHDAVIVVDNPKKKMDESFNSVAAFQKLDVNKDGVIDEKDPLYRFMGLMFFTNNGKNHRYITFAQAGIKSIQIDQQRLHIQDTSLDPKDNLLGEAIFNNGEKHSVRLIMISAMD